MLRPFPLAFKVEVYTSQVVEQNLLCTSFRSTSIKIIKICLGPNKKVFCFLSMHASSETSRVNIGLFESYFYPQEKFIHLKLVVAELQLQLNENFRNNSAPSSCQTPICFPRIKHAIISLNITSSIYYHSICAKYDKIQR